MSEFKRQYTVIWADLDPNRHMRHSAYNDYAAQVRLEFFAAFGMDLKHLMALGIGPILFREETRFYKEINMNERITVTFGIKRVRKDGSKWTILHNIFKENNELACAITVDGAWLDLAKRKVAIPPPQLAKILENAPRTEDFEWIPDKEKA